MQNLNRKKSRAWILDIGSALAVLCVIVLLSLSQFAGSIPWWSLILLPILISAGGRELLFQSARHSVHLRYSIFQDESRRANRWADAYLGAPMDECDFLDMVCSEFELPIKQDLIRLTSCRYDARSFGNAIVHLEAESFILRIVRDRGQIMYDLLWPKEKMAEVELAVPCDVDPSRSLKLFARLFASSLEQLASDCGSKKRKIGLQSILEFNKILSVEFSSTNLDPEDRPEALA